jgi:hypothetical protein
MWDDHTIDRRELNRGRHGTTQERGLTMLQDEGDSACPVLFAAKGHVNSGIMVLSSTCKLLYANKAAHDFLRRLNRKESDHPTNGAFPRSVDNLFGEMLNLLRTPVTNRGGKQLEARRLVAARDQPVLLQAFGIPDRLDIQRSRIVITIQETPPPIGL